jgi:G3E family GTPase
MIKLIFVGGFLGAGKTTLLHEVTRRLISGGVRVGLITNDQAPDLADTALLKHDYVNVAEVSGSCFCCDFKGLRRAIDNVGQHLKTDIIIAEPVGSCMDLSATLINPIKEMMKTEVSVCPLTVLVDPGRLKDILDGNTTGLHPAAAYIKRYNCYHKI